MSCYECLCPKCKTPMEWKGHAGSASDGSGKTFFQCPKCKEIKLT